MVGRFLSARRILIARFLVVGLMLVGCSGGQPKVQHRAAGEAGVARSGSGAGALPAALASAPGAPTAATPETRAAHAVETHVAVVEPTELAELERRGFALGVLVRGRDLPSAADLGADSGFKSIFEVLRADLRDTRAQHPGAKVTSVDGVRLFEAEWLASKQMSFRLVGVFNRLDRRAFYSGSGAERGSCGEVRFVYRLGYTTEQGKQPMQFRLPMTLNVVFYLPASDCVAEARAWQSEPGLAGSRFVEWLVGDSPAPGPLSASARRGLTLKSVEANVQSVRWQSSMIPSLGGHIEYLLRVFHAADPARERFEAAPMENMPDVARLKRDRALRAELLALLREPASLEALDDGVLVLPERFLARRAVSVSPRGLARPANRPFAQLFSPSDFADLDLVRTRTLGSGVALLRRLDGQSCVGCHQSRSIAGFHHVGNDPESTPDYAALESGLSTHLRADLARREAYVAALARSETPAEFRPIPEGQGVGNEHGAPCGLGDAGLAEWSCAPGFRCVALEDPEVGACFAEGSLGEPCEYGELVAGGRPRSDRVANIAKHACGAGMACTTNFSGFPEGSCDTSCAHDTPNRVCGDFLDVDAFQNCLRFRQPVAECARQHVFKTGLRACDAAHPCRQDYVCSRAGACLPPYFVYPLRLDGYPLRR